MRWLSTVLGFAALALAVLVVVRTMGDRPTPSRAESHLDAAPAVADAGVGSSPGQGKEPKDAGRKVADAEDPFAGMPEAPPGSLLGAHFPDGRPVPPLPENAPKHIKIGVVLMSFAGAQGASPSSRSKKDALELVTKLAGDAKTDFHAAVIRGDNGSSDDIGRMPRGVLEPAVEYTLFTLPVGAVSDPLETPRGYWIAKRTE